MTDGEDEQRAAEGIKTFFGRQKIEWMDKTNKRRRAVHLCAVLSFHEMEVTKYRGGDAVSKKCYLSIIRMPVREN